MAKVIFLQKTPFEWLGIMYISSVLKMHGHVCDIFLDSFERDDILQKALDLSPDIIAFSCLTSDYYWAIEKAKSIKQTSNTLIIMGGTHVTLNPDQVITSPYVDLICIGEGEYPVLELANAIDKKEDFCNIENLWVKVDSGITKNEIRNLIENLDSLPFPDRDLYGKYETLANRGKKPVDLGRGCPFNCSFCHNLAKKEIFKNKGHYVRWRSTKNVLAEIETIKKKRSVKLIHFVDDGFGVNQDSIQILLEGLSKYKYDRPVIQANMRADLVTDNLCKMLTIYGVNLFRIRIAVECGDEKYRNEVLKKQLTNYELVKAANIFHKYNIPFITYNIVGLPGETINQAFRTLELNIKLNPILAICFIFQPYPGTQLAKYAIEKGFLSNTMLSTLGTDKYHGIGDSKSILKQKNIVEIENLHKLFALVTKYPFLFPFVKKIIYIPIFSPLFRLVYRFLMSSLVRERQRRLEY